MDTTAIVNCKTGDVLNREMTPDENTQRQKDIAEHEKQQQDQQAEEAVHEGVFTQIAQVLKVPVSDLKAAFRVGKRAGQSKKDKSRK
jgi:hypothetical protein